MSPQAKEELYRSYLQGTRIKDLSLKYGILPQRVKAIVYQKHMYWEEVYPRLGETQLLAEVDKNRDGAISFREFVSMLSEESHEQAEEGKQVQTT